MTDPNESIARMSLLSRFSSRTSILGASKFKVAIQLLDDNETIFAEFKKGATGQDVLNHVCDYLDIAERDYFGLRYQDASKHRYWVDPSKPLAKHFRSENLALRFRIRFYPESPFTLKEEITRYQLFVQLQRDLLHGRLHCPQNDATTLAGLILQSVLGDYNEEEHKPGYVSEYRLLLKQTPKHEEKIAEAHRKFSGLTPAEAEDKFFEIASKLDTYGFDPYVVKDAKSSQEVILGATCRGLLLFVKSQKIQCISWAHLEKLDYIGKQLSITPSKAYVAEFIQSRSEQNPLLNSLLNESFGEEKTSGCKKHHLKFHCPSATFAKHLWRHLLSQQVFYTEDVARLVKPKFSKPRIPLLSRGSTFRCPTRRVQHEIEQEMSPPRVSQPSMFLRYQLPKQTPRADQPWVKLNGTLPLIKNSDLNAAPDAGVPTVAGELANGPVRQEATMQTTAAENVTEISIVMSKTEPVEQEEETSSAVPSCSDGSIPSSDKPLAEPRTSTPIQREAPEQATVVTNGSVAFAQPTLINHSQSNGHMANGNGYVSASASDYCDKTEPIAWTVLRWTLIVFLFFVLFIAVCIAAFEATEGTADHRWYKSIPQVDRFHSSVYAPWRHSVLYSYHRFFN